MAAWLLSFCVAVCVERCGFGTWCCKTHCNGCMDVAWALFWGKAGAGNLKNCLPRIKWLRPAMKGTSCVCGGCGCARTGPDRFLLCVLQWVVVHVCVVLCVSWLSGCRSQCNDCMIVVVLCCHMCVERCGFGFWCCKTHCNGCNMLHGCCMGFVLGENRGRKPCFSE